MAFFFIRTVFPDLKSTKINQHFWCSAIFCFISEFEILPSVFTALVFSGQSTSTSSRSLFIVFKASSGNHFLNVSFFSPGIHLSLKNRWRVASHTTDRCYFHLFNAPLLANSKPFPLIWLSLVFTARYSPISSPTG